MNFYPEKGIHRLKLLLSAQYNQIPEEFYALETRFANNRKEASLFGDNDPSIRGEFNRICFELHRFTNNHLTISFNELCQSQDPRMHLSLSGQKTSKGTITFQSETSNRDTIRPDKQRRWAVLVGVGRYDDERYHKLPFCVHDVTEIARLLYSSESGYAPETIHVLVDDAISPTRDNILATLKTVANETRPEDLLLFYYTGHGDYVQGESYLVPCDGELDNLKETALPISHVVSFMREARAAQKIIIFDACHAGANINSKGPKRMHPKFIERVFMQARGIEVLSSCEQDQLSYAWETQQHSVFTYFLLEALQGKADHNDKGFVSVSDIYDHVTNGVKSWCERKKYQQTPTHSHELSSGKIIVAYYKKSPVESAPHSPPSSEILQTHMQKGAIAPSATSWSWLNVDTVQVRDERYLLHRNTIHEEYTPDRQAVLRYAGAQHTESRREVWLKQVHIFHSTSYGEAISKILRQEYRLASILEQHRDFPRPLLAEGVSSNKGTLDTTIVYEAWTGLTLGAIFHQPGQPLEKIQLFQFLWHIIRVCQLLHILHRHTPRRYSHRSLNEDNIIVLNTDKRRTVLQDLGLIAQPAKSGKEQVRIQAPEQQYATLELGVPGPQTDIYQLGVIMYTVSTGQPLSSTRPDTLSSAISAELSAAMMRAIAFLPKDRWQDIRDFAHELKRIVKQQ